MENIRKLIKAEEEVVKANAMIQRLQKRLSDLEGVEAELKRQVATERTNVSRVMKEKDDISDHVRKLEFEKSQLVNELNDAKGTIEELRKKIRELNTEKAMQQLIADQSPKAVIEGGSVQSPRKDAPSPRVTPSSLIIQDNHDNRSEVPAHKLDVRDSSSQTLEVSGSSPSRPTPPSLLATHDSIAIPLRQKIRELTEQLDLEKHEHEQCREQLTVVKDELRRLVSDKSFVVDSMNFIYSIYFI
jgi:chromosome segregation ATPase